MNQAKLLTLYQAGERDFRGLDLPGIDLSYSDLSGIDLSRSNLRGANLFHVNLSHANLSYANLYQADLSCANLFLALLSGTNLVFANLSSAYLFNINLAHADLSGANLIFANLVQADLNGACLLQASLAQANLSGANLSGADLNRANVSGANLIKADLSNANLYQTNLTRCNAAYAIFRGADITQTDFRDTHLVYVEGLNCDRPPSPGECYEWQGLKFVSEAELKIAQALAEESLLFYPNCRTILAGQPEMTGYFLILAGGQWGILQIQAESFHLNIKRDRTLKHHGISLILSYSAQQCLSNPQAVIQEFLSYLRNSE